MRADFFPNLLRAAAWHKRFRLRDFALVAQDSPRDFGRLHGAFERTAQNQSGLNSGLGGGLQDLPELLAAVRRECSIGVGQTGMAVLSDAMTKKVNLHAGFRLSFCHTGAVHDIA